jgi:hypothetical protein
MSAEKFQPGTEISTRPLTFEPPHARWLREIVYATYRKPPQIIDQSPYGLESVHSGWIINASMPTSTSLVRQLPPSHYLSDVAGLVDQLHQSPIRSLAGFYRYQIVDVPSSGINGYVPPIEIFDLMDLNTTQWPQSLQGLRIGYISQMVIHPLIPSRDKPSILQAIHRCTSQLARDENVGLTVAIMTPLIAHFASTAGLTVHRLGGHPRWRDEEGNPTVAAQTIFQEFPGYWQTEDTPNTKQPSLWQVDLFE